jgi:hypothetical protein
VLNMHHISLFVLMDLRYELVAVGFGAI